MIAVLAGSAWAEGPAEEHELGVVAVRAIGVMAAEHGEVERLVGAGLAVETPPAHHLVLELAGAGTTGEHTSEIPVELVVERVFAVGAHLEPYLGLGPALVVRTDRQEHRTELRGGGVGVLGAHWWMGHHGGWGLLLETDVMVTGGSALAGASETMTGLVVRLR